MRRQSPKVTRMSGAGNTFFVVNNLDQTFKVPDRRQFTRWLCQHIQGLHSDGLLVLEKEQGVDFRWDFYNEDGSSAEMCGNAARCAAQYFYSQIGPKKEISFMTLAGLVKAEVLKDGNVKVELPALKNAGAFREIEINKHKEEYFFINTGVPHLIVEGEPDQDLGQALRQSEELQPAGSNVTFVQENSPGEIQAVTYERGVEDFTLACGTGAVAAAAFGREKNPLLKRFLIEMPGGDLLVEWLSDKTVALTGPAQFDFDLQADEDFQ